VKLLLDENLPPGLVRFIEGLFPGSSHVLQRGFGQTSDADFFRFAGTHGFTILTKDDDFVTLSQRFGTPPKVVLLKVGNASVATLRAVLQLHSGDIAAFIQSTDDLGLLVIGPGPGSTEAP
jgi:predicted nuclease of predicted toxin-antitoxin system